jgi:hypothetical protein
MAAPARHSRDKQPSDLLPELTAPQKSDVWTQHEHVSPPLQAHAQQLVDEAGSPELARQAVNAAEHHPPARASSQDEFARRWGFRSYLELFEGSTLVRSAGGKSWRVTSVSGGGWIAWNETDLTAERTFATREEAVSQVPSQDAV